LQVETRQARVDDVEFLTDVVVVATRDQGRFPAEFDEESWREGFAEWSVMVLDGTCVVEIDGEPAGRLRVTREPGVIELAGIQLLPRYQSRGVGTMLITRLIDEARGTGARLELRAEPDNPRARALYERLGFESAGLVEDELRMQFRG
jgi:GNAT superfamily N-acetyltransferase